jgi:hypothetical protein
MAFAFPLRRRLPDRGRVTPQPGVHEQHHGPSRGPLKTRGLQEKGLGVRDPRPLGAGMDSFAFSQPQEVLAATGARPSPTNTPPASSPRRRSWPLLRSRRKCCYAGKRLGVRDPRPLGTAMDSAACSSPARPSSCRERRPSRCRGGYFAWIAVQLLNEPDAPALAAPTASPHTITTRVMIVRLMSAPLLC